VRQQTTATQIGGESWDGSNQQQHVKLQQPGVRQQPTQWSRHGNRRAAMMGEIKRNGRGPCNNSDLPVT
jgi:hypothetical protein